MENATRVKTLRIFGWSTTALSVTIIVLYQTGCLTPDQQAAWGKYETSRAIATEKLAGYDKEIEAVLTMIEEGKYDSAEGKAILAKIKADKDAWKQVFENSKASLEELKAAESPWWVYVLMGLTTVAGGASAVLGGRAGQALGIANTCLGAVSRGITAVAPTSGQPITKAIGIEADKLGIREKLYEVKKDAALHII